MNLSNFRWLKLNTDRIISHATYMYIGVQTDRQTDRRTDGQTDGQRTDGRAVTHSHVNKCFNG